MHSLEQTGTHVRYLKEHFESPHVPDRQWRLDDIGFLAKDPSLFSWSETMIAIVLARKETDRQVLYDNLSRKILEGRQSETRKFRNISLVHLVAGIVSNYYERLDRPNGNMRLSIWSACLETGIRQGAELHALDTNSRTPFMMLLTAGIINSREGYNGALRCWIKVLGNAMVDLQQYGRIERLYMRKRYVQDDARHEGLHGLLGFRYGRNVSDWGLYWRHPGDSFAGIFWLLIENPPCQIPGAWIEDPDDLDWWEIRVLLRKCRDRGLKRRWLRQLKGKVQAHERGCPDSSVMSEEVEKLLALVRLDAEYWKGDRVLSYEDSHAYRKRMQSLAKPIGLMRAKWN